MHVYKFGGASIATPERVRALLPLLREAPQPLTLVVSALGKTTNALEEIVRAATGKNEARKAALIAQLEAAHLGYATELLGAGGLEKLRADLNVLFTELHWAADDADAGRFDYSYDQIVCMGELLATRIIAAFLQQEGLACEWADVRDVVRTDATWRDAKVNLDVSAAQAAAVLLPLLQGGKIVVTQGFIGATDDNASVTLGREGSDYTAALLGSFLGAEGVTIWKDVEGLLNADPKQFPNTVKIETITYYEVIEMAYFGAQVIHPKTIKPLQNRSIPLYVKSFLNPAAKGTVVQHEGGSLFYPSLIVLKREQVLLQVTTRDFSFISEENLSRIYQVFSGLGIKTNLIQNAAISFVACIDNNEEKVRQLIARLEADYKVNRNEDVSLLTIRHYTPEVLADVIKGRYVLLEQKSRNTVQVVMK